MPCETARGELEGEQRTLQRIELRNRELQKLRTEEETHPTKSLVDILGKREKIVKD